MPCKPCAQRRKEWKARQEARRAKGKRLEAAAIGAALAIIDSVAGEATHEREAEKRDPSGPDGQG